MEQPTYYDGTKLLSLKDINGNTPEIYMCSGNNTAGKTTYFSRLVLNKFINGSGKFMIVNRFRYELDECADKFFKDINGLFFKDGEMTSVRRAEGMFHELFYNNVSCGYAVAMNNVDQVKKYSHFFSDVDRMFFDEFQSETNHYCQDEVNKFRALHKAVARGQGKQVRYVPVYMCANDITLLNPYYVAMGISKRLNETTKFIRGDGFVLERCFVESASRAQKESGFNRAFGDDKYNRYSQGKFYLNDNYAFIERPQGNSRYIATIKYNGDEFAIREYAELGIIYIDDRADSSFPTKIAVTTDDHNINYVMLKRNDVFLQSLRYFFEKGCIRFRSLKCKEAILNTLTY